MSGATSGGNRTAPGEARDEYGNLVGSSAPYLKSLSVVKDPAGAAAGDSLLAAFNKYSASMPDLNQMISGLKDRYGAAQSNLDAAYRDQQANLDPSEWINARRMRDAELAGLTAGYEGNLGALGGRYDATLGRYETAGRGLVDEILSKGQNYIDTIIPQQSNLALSKALTYLDKYGISNAGAGGGTGASSGGATLAGRAVSEATLPYMAQAQQMQQDLRRNVALPFEGDIANRYTNKITGFDYPVAADIYNRYGALNAQQRSTEDAIYGAKQAASAGRVQSAIGQLMSAGMSVQQMAQVLQLPLALVSQQAQVLAQILQNRNISTQFGIEDIRGSNVTLPQGYDLNRPAPYIPNMTLPDRYSAPTPEPKAGAGASAVAPNRYYVPPTSSSPPSLPTDYLDSTYGPGGVAYQTSEASPDMFRNAYASSPYFNRANAPQYDEYFGAF